MRPASAWGIALLLAASACGSPSGPSRDVPLGRPFELAVGESVMVQDELLLVTFDGVREDSRCPADVVCVRAGDAVAALRLRRLPVQEAAFLLHTNEEPRQAQFQGYRVALELLAPYPLASQPTRPGDYVATLRVDRP